LFSLEVDPCGRRESDLDAILIQNHPQAHKML
jgi:hypothetical protein